MSDFEVIEDDGVGKRTVRYNDLLITEYYGLMVMSALMRNPLMGPHPTEENRARWKRRWEERKEAATDRYTNTLCRCTDLIVAQVVALHRPGITDYECIVCTGCEPSHTDMGDEPMDWPCRTFELIEGALCDGTTSGSQAFLTTDNVTSTPPATE